MKRFFLSALALLFLLTATLWAGEKRPVLIINEDNDHYFKQTADLMTLEALQAYIDRMKDSHVTHFFMCPQGQRTSYDSKVHERIWDGMADGSPVNYGPGEDGKRWTSNCKKLFEMGIDPYTVWIDRCREDGISPFGAVSSCDAPKQITGLMTESVSLLSAPFTMCVRSSESLLMFS